MIFSTRWRVLLILGPLFTAAAFVIQACRGCDIAGVFYFCNDEGPHQVIQDPPPSWRARALEVQNELAAYTALHFPDSAAKFYRRDVNTIVFVRVLGHGVPGAAARQDGDSVLFNADNEENAGIMRHEFVHWVQQNNGWLAHDPSGRLNIHYPPIFEYVRAPLVGG